MLFDVSVDTRIPIRARSAWRDVVKNFGVLDSILFAQFAVGRHYELLDVVTVRGRIIVTQQRQALMTTGQFRPQP